MARAIMPIDEPLWESLRRIFVTLTAGLLTTLAAVGLVGCAKQPEAARHTVAEYQANAELRREQFARCAADPAALGSTPDCMNVRQATLLEDTRSVREMPPVKLPPLPDRPPKSPRE
jgi:hypothetical protein